MAIDQVNRANSAPQPKERTSIFNNALKLLKSDHPISYLVLKPTET